MMAGGQGPPPGGQLEALGPTLGGGLGRYLLTERCPSYLKKSFASGGVFFFENCDVGEGDTDRIATFDVTRLLVFVRISESEEN
jgi:hypothetical protein